MSATLAPPPHLEQIPAAGLLLLTLRFWSTRKQKNTICIRTPKLVPLSYGRSLRVRKEGRESLYRKEGRRVNGGATLGLRSPFERGMNFKEGEMGGTSCLAGSLLVDSWMYETGWFVDSCENWTNTVHVFEGRFGEGRLAGPLIAEWMWAVAGCRDRFCLMLSWNWILLIALSWYVPIPVRESTHYKWTLTKPAQRQTWFHMGIVLRFSVLAPHTNFKLFCKLFETDCRRTSMLNRKHCKRSPSTGVLLP